MVVSGRAIGTPEIIEDLVGIAYSLPAQQSAHLKVLGPAAVLVVFLAEAGDGVGTHLFKVPEVDSDDPVDHGLLQGEVGF